MSSLMSVHMYNFCIKAIQPQSHLGSVQLNQSEVFRGGPGHFLEAAILLTTIT